MLMSLTDPAPITHNAIALTLPRISVGQNNSKYHVDTGGAAGLFDLTASHAYGRRTRRSVRLDQSKFSADPLTTGVNIPVSASAYVVIDVPKVGFTATEQLNLYKALSDYLAASSYAVVNKLINGEN
jgi:hypothetical protein